MNKTSDDYRQIPDHEQRPADADRQDEQAEPADEAAQSQLADADDQSRPADADRQDEQPELSDEQAEPVTGLDQEKLADFDHMPGAADGRQPLDKEALPAALEALLFVAGDPLPLDKIASVIGVERTLVRQILGDMEKRLRQDSRRGLLLREVEGAYFFCTKPEQKHILENLFQPRHRPPLSQAAYETLAIIAYNQPVTRAQVESVRGVNSDSIISRLLERNLICDAGTLDAPGRPVLFATTEQFLNDFGLRSADELPPMEMLMYGTLRDFEASLEEATGRRDRQISIDQIVSAFVPGDEQADASTQSGSDSAARAADKSGETALSETGAEHTAKSAETSDEKDLDEAGADVMTEEHETVDGQMNDREVLDVSGALFGEPDESD